MILVLDARDKGATAAAAVVGSTALAGKADIGGLIVVGLEDGDAGRELAASLRRDAGLDSWVDTATARGAVRPAAGGAVRDRQDDRSKPPPQAALRLCEEAARYLKLDKMAAIAARRGYVPTVTRRLFARDRRPAGFGRVGLAVAWGPPLQPLALENIDLLQAAGADLRPLNLGRDRELPTGVERASAGRPARGGAASGLRRERRSHGRDRASGLGRVADARDRRGALLLLRRLADSRGRSHSLVGAVPAEAELIESYCTRATSRSPPPVRIPYDDGENVLYELFDLEYLVLEQESFAYQVRTGDGEAQAEGFALHRCLVTTLYPSMALSPALADRFIETMRSAGTGSDGSPLRTGMLTACGQAPACGGAA